MTYRNKQGQFVTKFDYERTYGTLEEPEYHLYPYKQIHQAFYFVWIVASAFGIGLAFFLGSIAYR